MGTRSNRNALASNTLHSGVGALIIALAVAGCASGTATDGGPPGDAGRSDGGRVDGGRRDAGGTDSGMPDMDGGPPDSGFMGDAGPLCGERHCVAFEYCDDGVCREYPACAGNGTCPRPGDVCHNRRCVPGDVDVDGDGVVASEDCDETNPARFPGNSEICNSADEDCDEIIDEGDPSELCDFSESGGICMSGTCGCPDNTFDIDRTVPGCECTAAPPSTQGATCATAINVGTLADSGQMQTVSGNVLPANRDVWYRFRATDSADTSCDNFHVRARFTSNPDDTFEFTVFRGSCSTAACASGAFNDFRWATDFRGTVGGRTSGQCPCTAPDATRVLDRSVCENDSADFYVRVRRREGSTLSCQSFTLELSNGVYSSPISG